MKIITISGLDGSGKSTQIQMLKSHLESQGKQVFYFHAIESGLAAKLAGFKKKYCLICKLKGLCRVQPAPKKGSVTEANWLQIKLREIFLAIDLKRFRALAEKLEKENCDFILSDRYFYDTLINIGYLAKSDSLKPASGIQKPDAAFYLDADPELIMRRERKPDQGVEYLKKKKNLYDKYALGFGLQTIDGDRTPAEIFAEIKEKIA